MPCGFFVDGFQKIKGFLTFFRQIQVNHKAGVIVRLKLEFCFFKLVKKIVQGVLNIAFQSNVAFFHLVF